MGQDQIATPRDAANQGSRDLLVEICRYHAQILYAARNGLDIMDQMEMVSLPNDGVVPAQTILLDGVVQLYQEAADTLVECGFATQLGYCSEEYRLEISSDQFALNAGSDVPKNIESCLNEAFLAIFRIYADSRRLGHPETLGQIFKLLKTAGFVEERYGFLAWSQRAVDLVKPKPGGTPGLGQTNLLWNIDSFDCFIEEAASLWAA